MSYDQGKNWGASEDKPVATHIPYNPKNDSLLYRGCMFGLVVLAILCIGGVIALSCLNKEIPDILVKATLVVVGPLAGFFAFKNLRS